MSEVVHDLRAPLAVIRSQCQQLEGWLDDARAAELRRIRHTADAMSERMEALLEREFPRELVQPVPVDVAALAADVAERLRPLARMRGVLIAVGVPARATVLGDPHALESALQNLLDNAIRYSPDGDTIRCTVRARLNRVTVVVDDAGPGIPAADRERVLTAGVTGAGGRTGLGLALAERAARAHGGTLRLEAAPEGGTRAVLVLTGTRVRERATRRRGRIRRARR